MKTRKYRLSVIALTGFATAVLSTSQTAQHPPHFPPVFEQVYYDGKILYMGGAAAVGDLPAGPYPALYAIVDQFPNPTAKLQLDVLSKIPGDAGYNPRWEAFPVIVLDGRDVSTNPFTSDEQILTAEAAGKVKVIDAGFSFSCPVNMGRP